MNAESMISSPKNVRPEFYFGKQLADGGTLEFDRELPSSVAYPEFRTEYDPQKIDALWHDFYFGELHDPASDPDYLAAKSLVHIDKIADRSDTSFEDNLYYQFEHTKPWVVPAPKNETDDAKQTREQFERELPEAQAFIIDVTRVLDQAYAGNNSADRFLEQASFSLDKIGAESNDRNQDIAHQARYMAFYLSGQDFTEESRDVEEVFNQRATPYCEWPALVRRAYARVESDPSLTNKVYTCLPQFTNDSYERSIAASVISLTLMEIAHWEKHQGVFGDIHNLTKYHLQMRIDAIVASEVAVSSKWANKINRLEQELRSQKDSSTH